MGTRVTQEMVALGELHHRVISPDPEALPEEL